MFRGGLRARKICHNFCVESNARSPAGHAMSALPFNMLLASAGRPTAEVRLLRHQTRLPDGRTPLDLWRGDPAILNASQSYQQTAQRPWLKAPWWATFLGTADGRTLFAGIYAAGPPYAVEESFHQQETGCTIQAGSDDFYALSLSPLLAEYIGRLYINWSGGSSGKRAWKQRADLQDKNIMELHLEGVEQPFPGLMDVAEPLSRLVAAPPGWIAQLEAAHGVYLLTCPINGEQYVGSATGAGGFGGRWTAYAADGHGGNVALRARARTDWIVSILQAAGSADTDDDILTMKRKWKRKLHSRALDLNRN